MTKKSHILNWNFHKAHWDMNIIEFYIFQALYKLANTMINLFLPIFLLVKGYGVTEVILFFVIMQILFILFNPFTGKVIEKLGVKHSIALKIPCYIAFFIGLKYISGNFIDDIYLIFIILIFRASGPSISNVAVDIFMAKNIVKKNPGKMIASLKILLTLSGILAPLLGGFISYFYGFNALFYFGIVLVLLSGIPLFLTPDKHFKVHYKPQQLFSFLLHKTDKNYLIAETGYILPDTMMWIMWPLFLFFAIKNTADLGLLLTISTGISIVISYYIGKKVDSKQGNMYLINGVRLSSISLFLRSISLNSIIIGIINAIDNMIEPIWKIPYDNIAYKVINQHHDQIKMANLKQLISEILYTLGTLILLVISYLNGEISVSFFVMVFGIFSIISLLTQRMTCVKVKDN